MHETDRWSLALLAREATRNVFSTAARLFPVVLLAVLLGSAQASLAVQQGQGLERQIAELRAQGRNVLAATQAVQDSPVLIDRDSCEGLTALSVVERAGIQVLDAPSMDLPQLGAKVPVRPVSTTLLPELATHDAVVGRSIAESAGRGPSQRFDLVTGASGSGTVSALVGSGDGAGLGGTGAVFVAADRSIATSATCSVVLTPFADASAAAPVIAAALDVQDNPVLVSTELRETTDVVALFLTRIERFLPLLLGAIGGLTVAVVGSLRSSELAAYRLSGTSPRSLGVLLALEQSLVAGTFVTASAATTLLLAGQALAPAASVLWTIAGGLVWLVVGNIVALPVLRRRPSDMAKDR
ncbi:MULTISPECIES: hypothetical protein [Oerskovia]|uniref:FtsX-like permease family protein n=1 Tax=Oerskovia rustica TaxID=2762237 RepID=A0ABR8RNS0_9CELL|nr:hypothetical protein [Oerskovia rustica]MBD7949317.1 hypothetical protein [Oerskovia rustica]